MGRARPRATSSSSPASATSALSARPSPLASLSRSRKHRRLRPRLKRNQQRSAAMIDQIPEQQRRVAELVLRLKAKWQEDVAPSRRQGGRLQDRDRRNGAGRRRARRATAGRPLVDRLRQEPERRTSPRSSAPSLMLRTASAKPWPAAPERLGRTPEDRAEARVRGS
jgi:hypothetical protein